MSQSTKTTAKVTDGSNPTVFASEQTTTIATSKNTIKRNISDETEHQTKKLMTDQCSSSTTTKNSSKSSFEIKFISAAEIAVTSSSKTDSIPEMSDEELLQISLIMEKNNQQQ